MSVILACKYKNKLVIGADTRVSVEDCGCRIINIKESKLVKFNSGIVVGAVGYGGVTETLWSMSAQNYSITNRAELYTFVKDYYTLSSDTDDTPDKSAELLIATPDKRIYYALSKLSVQEIDKYWAIGIGAPFTLGALYITYPQLQSVCDLQDTVGEALEVACEFCPSCGPPMDIISVG